MLKTIILLSSGVSVTAAHFYLIISEGKDKFVLGRAYLLGTVVLGVVFLFLQVEEYIKSLVRFNRRVYGSAFFILTGFHGLHVTIGAIALLVVWARLFNKRVSSFDHAGFECAAWY